jgi:hypothetical protein
MALAPFLEDLMNRNLVIRTFGLLSASALVSALLAPHVLRAQDPQSAPKSTAAAPAVSQAAQQSAKEDKQAAPAASASKDATAILTKEVASWSARSPMLVDDSPVAGGSFTRQYYRVEWRQGDPFDLYVIRPKKAEKPPVIIYLPSFPDDTEQFKNNGWCDAAVQGGYAIVGFVGAVTGHRTRYRPMKEWFVSEIPEALTSTTHDVQLILDYLATRDDVDASRVAMYGVGSGGAIGILASVVDSRIKVLDVLAPWGDWKNWLKESKVIPDDEREAYTKPEFVAGVTPLDPVIWLPKVQALSVRIEDIRRNRAMPDKSQETLEAAAPDFASINEYGNLRAFMTSQPPMMALGWVKSELTAGAKSQVAVQKSARVHVFPAVAAPPAPPGIPDSSAAAQAAKASVPPKENEKPQ